MRVKMFILMMMLFPFSTVSYAQKQMIWIGGPTYKLKLGSFTVLTDPMFESKSDTAFLMKKHSTTGAENAPIKRIVPPSLIDTADIDVLLVSHLHPDHFDDAARKYINKQTTVMATPDGKELLTTWGFLKVKSLDWDDASVIRKGKQYLKITAVPAYHATNEPLRSSLGMVNGYVMEYFDGKQMFRVYWTGDTVWFPEIWELNKYGTLDLLIPNMGGVGANGPFGRRSLNADECLKIVNSLGPMLTIPVHHSTFSHYDEPISILEEMFAPSGSQKLIIPASGTPIDIN